MAGPALSIVIPTYNGLQWLQRSLPRVLAYAPAEAEVIVVDDASTDGTISWLARWKRVRVIRRRCNGGFCAAVNDGIRAARGEIVQTLNNDVLVTPGWTRQPMKLLRDPSVAAVAPLVLDLNQPDRIDSAGDGWHLCGRAYSRGNRQLVGTVWLAGTEEVFGASASAAFYRRSVLEEVGSFPAEFGAYYDDIDLAFRIRHAGYRALFCSSSVVYHAVHGSYGGRLDPERVRRLARNEEFVFWRCTPRGVLPLALPMHVVYVLLHAGLLWFEGRPAGAYLKGRLLDAWAVRRELWQAREGLPRRMTVASLRRRYQVETSWGSLFRVVYEAARRRLEGASRDTPQPTRRAA